jgi:hypothetical protein
MVQIRLAFGRNVATLVVVSTLLTGCMGSVESGGYEVVLDQPDASVSESVAVGLPDKSVKPLDSLTPPSEANQPSVDELPPEAVSGRPDEPVATSGAAPEAAVDNGVAVDGSPGNQVASLPTESASGNTPETKGPQDAADTKASTESQPRVVKLLIPEKTFAVEGAEKALRVSFDDFDLLKVLNMDPVSEDAPSRMPKWLKQLDGKRIRVRGFMYPPFEETGIRGFTLARDNQICCFGRNPLVYDLVDIFMRSGETTQYIQNRPFDVIGVFHIGESIIPGELYSMDDAIVIDR